jgi:hypothetical protein
MEKPRLVIRRREDVMSGQASEATRHPVSGVPVSDSVAFRRISRMRNPEKRRLELIVAVSENPDAECKWLIINSVTGCYGL